jgi:NAD(P)-dependent dehydrogenase (short-subunit alcohol dehydrogenase family)
MALKNPFDFSGKTVILTGGAGGLGSPICMGFARAGAQIVIFDIDEKALEGVAAKIKDSGGLVWTARVDLCSQKEVEDSVSLACQKFDKIDVLVNLVGGVIRKPSVDYPLEDWQRVMDINLKACWLCCQAVGRVMIIQKRGRIINFSSNAGLHGLPNYPAYCPAKAAVMGLTRVLAVEWGPHGICTNAIAPGFVKTPINAELMSEPKAVERFLTRMPLGELMPADAMVEPTLFLASDAARWINGHTLHVDAGYHAT